MKPTSHLTRGIFRAIIANRPYIFAECRRQGFLPAKPYTRHTACSNYIQRRTLFGFITGTPTNRGFQGAKATPKNLELALGKLINLVNARRSQSRPPKDEELLDALKFLFSARLETGRPLTRNEVYIATETFKHLTEREHGTDGEGSAFLERDDLRVALEALSMSSTKERYRSDVLALARMLYQSVPNITSEPSWELITVYITILASNGSAKEAFELLRRESIGGTSQAWIPTLKGLISEGHEDDFWKALGVYQKICGDLTPVAQEQLVTFLAQKDQVWAAQHVYDMPLNVDSGPTTETIKQLLEMCLRLGKENWANTLAAQLSRKIGEEGVVGTLILWHAVQDTNPKAIEAAIHELLEQSRTDVNMDTFNRIVEYAFQQNKPSLAATVLRLAQAEGFRENGKTYAFRLQQAIDVSAMSRAIKTFEAMSVQDIPSDGSDLPILNRFITKLSSMPEPNYEVIMRVADTLIERNAEFDAEAVAGLCHVLLQRDEIEDLTSLLRPRIDFYSTAERARISAIFQTFITDAQVKAQRAFNAYELFRHAFPETPVAQRLPLMQSFFDRKRPDLACLVFGHMRQREDRDDPARPTTAAYAQCFEGIAQCRDVDGLQMVYNMLKLDIHVERTTHVRNAVMLAQIACQMPWAAIIDHFWKIMDSREGPSYSTFEVALRACETWVPYGSFEARKIIAVLQEWNLEITKDLYDSYIGAIAGQAEFEDAVQLIENMEEDIGERPDAITIGTFYNAIPWQFRRDEVEKWAKQVYPELWEDLLTFGDEIDEEWELRYFKIDRSIDIGDEPLFARGEWKPELARKTQAQIEPLTLTM